MTEAIIAWMAGFVDGEGCILIEKVKPRKNRPNAGYTPTIVVINTDPVPLSIFSKFYGGLLYLCSPKGKFGKRPCYRWVLKGEKLKGMLKQLLPYLVVKRPQAELALDFLSKRAKPNQGYGYGRVPYEAEEILWRESIYLRMREFNRGSKKLISIPQHRDKKQLSFSWPVLE